MPTLPTHRGPALLVLLAVLPVGALAETDERSGEKLQVLWQFDTGG
jgi:hypothetical protein